jgi:hypothetical protein
MLLVYILSERGIEAIPETVSTIMNMGPIKTSRESSGSWVALRP